MIDTDHGFVPLLNRMAENDPSRVYAHRRGNPVTFAEIGQQSDSVAHWLSGAAAPGARIAVMARNRPEVIALIFGIAKAGMVWVPINTEARDDNLAFVLDHAEPDLVVADRELVETIRSCGARRECPIWILGSGDIDGTAGRLESVLEATHTFTGTPPVADDLIAIMYTSGTTGEPKGVMVSHRMLLFSAESIALMADCGDGDVFHMWEPLFHIGGAQMILLPLIRKARLAMVERFSASRFWDEVRSAGATRIHYLGGILQILMKQPPDARDRDHSVRIAFGGGCPAHIWRDFEERFGIEIREAYGMTEASSVTTYNDEGKPGAVGRPVPWHSVAVLDPRGRPLPPGERGEIVVTPKVPGAITVGYYRNPEATAKTIRNGSLHTGDVGSIDSDGNLVFHGRRTDSARVRGHNVSAWEVEHVAAQHPDIEDCAMIAIPAEIGEHEIKLFVKPKPGVLLDAPVLSAWLGVRLADFQNPRYLKIVEAFERTPSQRIKKHRLSPDVGDAWDRQKSETET